MATILLFPSRHRVQDQKALLFSGILREGTEAILESISTLGIDADTDPAAALGVAIVQMDAGETARAVEWAERRFNWINRRSACA